MANATETEVRTGTRNGTLIIAIIVPSVLIIALLGLIIFNRRRAFLLPQFGHDEALVKEKRWQTRRDELESTIKSQDFRNWLEGQKEKKPGSHQTADPLCAICLDEFVHDAQVRGLQCSHAFHSHCLDEWFTRYNEYCPLCHGPIIPGSRAARRKARERLDGSIPVILMV
ncbi:hypothetical protein BDW02DRAFT_502600 [Decorospora gaudefroyi]|uniref:RING-type domain-containing protein n=1 Tax=Decorospora gaudefroyi TaxID=184978 RepID=A0A6A5KBN1_9PLEO|nr:hypothetical protein BDW02DRAFT_502600 [Decorospora gaudefroyi]